MEQNKKIKCVVAINEGDFGSTGFVAKSVLDYCNSKGISTRLFCIKQKHNFPETFSLSMGKAYDFWNRFVCRIDASDGFHNKKATRVMLEEFDILKPDIVHLHNIHGHYVNLELLFDYCKRNNIKIVWTLHDCWSFTGKCPHFLMANCDKWKTSCCKCPLSREYPAAYIFDRASHNLNRKQVLFNKYKDIITLVTPSNWLMNCLSESKLKDLQRIEIPNGIDLTYLPASAECKKMNFDPLKDKIVFFSATYGYSKRKGLEFITKLANELDSTHYAFIVAGLDGKHPLSKSPNIILPGLLTKDEMNYYYSISNAFLNPTLEDNFPTVNLEALSHGLPVITFDSGGSSEMLTGQTGIVIERGNYEALKNSIFNFKKDMFSLEKCKERAKFYSKEKMCENYYALFQKVTTN